MQLTDCIKTRRSIRKYENRDVSEKIIRELLDSARHAPSACNTQPWEFVVIKSKESKRELADIHKYCSFIKDAPVIIAVCYDNGKVKFSPSDLASSAVAAQNLLLAVHDHGLGACWVYVKDTDDLGIEKNAKKILRAPENISILCLISVGYPGEVAAGKKLRRIDEILHNEKF